MHTHSECVLLFLHCLCTYTLACCANTCSLAPRKVQAGVCSEARRLRGFHPALRILLHLLLVSYRSSRAQHPACCMRALPSRRHPTCTTAAARCLHNHACSVRVARASHAVSHAHRLARVAPSSTMNYGH